MKNINSEVSRQKATWVSLRVKMLIFLAFFCLSGVCANLPYNIKDAKISSGVEKEHNANPRISVDESEAIISDSPSLQSFAVSGVVLDEKGLPMSGVYVLEKGTKNGISTDLDGKFSFSLVNESGILVFSFIGYKTLELPATKEMRVTMEEESKILESVVILGYGTQKKAVLAGSVATVDGKEISKEPLANVTQQLQGKASGVQIIANDAPGQSSSIIIRGLGTALGGRDPLYVVDGILTDNISNLNSYDIASVNVLKDAASLAIYGNRGANGVVMITTKQGDVGKMKISADAYGGFRTILSTVKMANADQYVAYSNEATKKSLLANNDPTDDSDTRKLIDPNQRYNTNWLKAITQIGHVMNYNVSLSGGTEKLKSFFSVGYFKEEGVLPHDIYNRLTIRGNNEYKISKKLKFSNNVSLQLANSTPQNYERFTLAYRQAPITPVKDELGRWGSSLAYNNVGNPAIGNTYSQTESRFLKLQGVFKLDYELTDWLTYTSRFSVQTEYSRTFVFSDNLGSFLANNYGNTVETFRKQGSYNTTLEVTRGDTYRWFADNFFTFNKTFLEVHHVDATLGTTAESIGGETLKGKRVNVPLDENLKYNLDNGSGGQNQTAEGSVNVPQKLHSYIFRANYSYKNKYLFSTSYRRDGSSQFQKGHRYGNFYSFGGGWVVSNESFMDNSPFDVLKLRGSYGQLGNQNVPLNVATATLGSGALYPFGKTQTIQQGTTIDAVVDPNLTWEITREYDLGVEFTLFHNRLSGEIDYYNRTNANAILPLQLPKILGLSPFNYHVGEIVNKGLELTLNWSEKFDNGLSYNIGGNFTYNQNELTKINNVYFDKQRGGDIKNGKVTKLVEVGHPIGSFWLYEQRGINSNGDMVYVDKNKDGTIDDQDRSFFGSYIPKMYFSVNLGLSYKGFNFSVQTFSNIGNQLYNGKKAQRYGNENIEESVFADRWVPGKSTGSTPGAFNNVPLSSNYYLESGSFFRINTIILGYTIPKKIFKWGSIRVYITAKNPLIFKKFSGFNPELPGTDGGNPLGNAGIELNSYPALRSFYGGVNITF